MQKIHYKLKRNRIIKYLFLISGVLVFLLIFIPLYHKENIIPGGTEEATDLKPLGEKATLSMDNPVFEGLNKDELPYRITAETVTRQYDNTYNLNFINARYTLPKGNLKMLAETGVLDDATKLFILSQNVRIILNSFTLAGDRIAVNLNSNSAHSDSPVEIVYKHSKIMAKRFYTEDSNNIIHFEGNVISTFYLDDF